MDDVRIGALLILCSAVGFGTLGIFGVIAGDAGVSIPTILFLRFALASLLVWTVLWSIGEFHILDGKNLYIGFLLGAVGYAGMSGFYFLGLEYMTAGMVAIVLYTYPALVLIMAAVFLGESVGPRRLTALITTLAGVALITGADPAAADPRGVAIVFLAAIIYASYITVSRTTLINVSAPTLSAHVMPAAAFTFLIIGLTTDTLAMPEGALAWGSILGIVVLATAIPIFAFFAGLSRIGAGPTAILSTLEPAVTVALGAVFLAEPVSGVVIIGGTLVIAGVILVSRR